MKSVMFFFTILLFFIEANYCCNQENKRIKISPFDILNETDTFYDNNKVSINRKDYFLVETNLTDTAKIYEAIQDFLKKDYPKNFQKYSRYELIFYKLSFDINSKKNYNNPKIIRRDLFKDANPTIITYTSDDNGFNIIDKYIDGKIIGDSSSKVTDILVDSSKN